MTVEELIKKLQEMPPNADVSYAFWYNDTYDSSKSGVEHNSVEFVRPDGPRDVVLDMYETRD